MDRVSFLEFVEWALSENLVYNLSKLKEFEDKSFFAKKTALKDFRGILIERTGRGWSLDDLNVLFNAVKIRVRKHYRESIDYGEFLKLLWNTPYECAMCKKVPPEVKLHIDHIKPVTLGGNSKFNNLRFLCRDCNLRKSDKIQEGKPWLKLE